jgi:hypothetical protein
MANPVNVTHILQPNTLAKASDVNDNFDDVVQWINSNVPHRDGTVPFSGVPSIPAQGPSQPNQVAHKAYVDALLPRFVPVGTVIDYVGTSAPTGWRFMNGQTLQGASVSFPELWAVAPTAWRSGNDLVLPDMRGRTTVMLGSAPFNTMGGTGGSKDAVVVQHGHGGTLNSGSPINTGNTSANLSTSNPTAGSNLSSHTHTMAHTHGMRHAHAHGSHTHSFTGSQHRHTLNQPNQYSFVYRSSNFLSGGNTFRVDAGSQIQLGWETNTEFTTQGGTVAGGNNGVTGRARNEANTANVDNTGPVSTASTAGPTSVNHIHQFNHRHQVTIPNAGVSGTNANMPPYCVLNKIIKVS